MTRLHGNLWALLNSPDEEEDVFALMSTSPARFKIYRSKSSSDLSMYRAPVSEPIPIKKFSWEGNVINEKKGKNVFSPEEGEPSEDDYERLPPHEIVKKRTMKNRFAYSMCEGGFGRTLKGRDLINVRTMVLTMTGFIES
ncbi:hypothetical protein STAS_21839 [Striga asiatica]|uniref:Uncharacterized protein n=1 Tax=Striga asiatica TaxID=4170 RepID=A0A5A7QJ22_STRAF|nr:hypothetical protein STAS_21839 [Striga asiatica]